MFRRKEDSLFDNTTDPNQEDEASSSSSSSSSSASGSASGSGSSASGSHSSSFPSSSAPTSSYGQSMPRPPAAATPAAPATPASSFRPGSSSSTSADLGRNRMPEAGKPSAPSMPASSGPIPAPASAVESKLTKTPGGGTRRVLTVGNDILLKGEIATCDRLVIEGKVDATLNDVHTVEIAEHGSFKGSANIEDAEISGLFEGDLIVRNRLVIYATGKVRGTITYGEIEIERGGELSGEIKSNASGLSGNSSSGSSSRVRQKSKEAA